MASPHKPGKLVWDYGRYDDERDFVPRRRRDNPKDYTKYHEDPSSQKVDREEHIYDQKGFKDELNQVQKDFEKKTKKRKKK